MNDRDVDTIGISFVIGFLFCILMTFLIGGCHLDGIKDNQKEAVKVGVGRWVPQPDGSTVFEWITPEKK